MALEIIQVEYYSTVVEDQIANASKLITEIVGAGVDFHAFKSVPAGQGQMKFSFFAKDSSKLTEGAEKSGLNLEGPHSALFIKGDEKSGELAQVYEKLSQAGIQVEEAFGIADINAGYGIILCINHEDCSEALEVLKS